MTTPAQALANLTDALVADILALSDEEILEEMREDGHDPEQVAAEMRALVERATKNNRAWYDYYIVAHDGYSYQTGPYTTLGEARRNFPDSLKGHAKIKRYQIGWGPERPAE